MAYNEITNKAAIKYVKEHQKQIMIKYKISDYESRVEPAIKKSGMPVATFIKQAINEKIERDGLNT